MAALVVFLRVLLLVLKLMLEMCGRPILQTRQVVSLHFDAHKKVVEQ